MTDEFDPVAVRQLALQQNQARMIREVQQEDREFAENDLRVDPTWGASSRILYEAYNGNKFEGTDEEAGQYGLEQMSNQLFSFYNADPWSDEDNKGIVEVMNSWDGFTDDQKLAFGYMSLIYDQKDISWAGTGRAFRALGNDPTNLLSVVAPLALVFRMGGRTAAKAGFHLVIRDFMKKHPIIKGAMIGGVDGAAVEVIDDNYRFHAHNGFVEAAPSYYNVEEQEMTLGRRAARAGTGFGVGATLAGSVMTGKVVSDAAGDVMDMTGDLFNLDNAASNQAIRDRANVERQIGAVNLDSGIQPDQILNPPTTRSLKATPYEANYFDTYLNEAGLEEILDQVPSFKYENGNVTVADRDLPAFGDWLTQAVISDMSDGVRPPPRWSNDSFIKKLTMTEPDGFQPLTQPVRQTPDPQTVKSVVGRYPNAKKLIPYLSAREITMLDRPRAGALVDNTLATLDEFESAGVTASEMADVAVAGEAKRGWYQQSGQHLSEIFAEDFPRFAALLAATSPKTSVKANLQNTVNIWLNWEAAGRPQDKDTIVAIMADSVQGSRGLDSVLPAWINNSVTALTEPEAQIILSGGKVDSFMRNIMGDSDAVTADTWMANYFGTTQAKFGGGKKPAWPDNPGKPKAYMAVSAITRKAAKIATKRTGSEWTPAEIQETVWSYVKVITEMQRSGDSRTIQEIVESGDVTDEVIRGADDFATLLTDPDIAEPLRGSSYGERFESTVAKGRGDVSTASSGDQKSDRGSNEGPRYRQSLRRVGRRIEAGERERKSVEAD